MGVVNKPDFTVGFSQNNSDIDIPETQGSVKLRLQSQFFIPCGNTRMIVLTKVGVTTRWLSCIGFSCLQAQYTCVDVSTGLKLALKLAQGQVSM